MAGARTMFDLTGRRALVTGSSGGIDLALAAGPRDAGAEIVLDGHTLHVDGGITASS